MSDLQIDLTDLVVHSIYYGVYTGVQRVQINLAHCLVQSVSAKTFSIFGGQFENLNDLIVQSRGDADGFLHLIREYYADSLAKLAHQRKYPILSIPSRCFRKSLKTYRDRKIRLSVKFGPSDAIFTMGAFWHYLPCMDFYKQKAAEGTKLIGILHDLIWATPTYPKYTDKKMFEKFLSIPFNLITVSAFTKNELEKAVREGILSCSYKSLRHTSLAHEFVGVQRNQQFAQHFAKLKDKKYVLYVSSLEPHKNHATLISVWKELYEELGGKLPPLVLAGRRARSAEEILKPNNLGTKITFCESPSDEQLRGLYANCMFTVFPSLIEGWGLPVGEGLWFGKACAASNRASIPEVGEDLCLYFDPEVPSEMKNAIISLLDPEVRGDYENKIRAAKLRSWEDVAGEIERMIISILDEED